VSRPSRRRLLVLWDVDHTLIDSGAAGTQLYRLVFRDPFGRDLSAIPAVAGRNTAAVVAAINGVPRSSEPGDFQARQEFQSELGRELSPCAPMQARRDAGGG
jgi:hypothetical protein